MNRFDRAVNRKVNDFIIRDFKGTEVDDNTYKKYAAIARAMVRTEYRDVKPSNKPKSLYKKIWKNAEGFNNLDTSAV